MKVRVGLTALLIGGFLTAQSAVAIENRPERTTEHALGGGGGTIIGGVMNIEVINGCYALITGTVDTPNTGGTVTGAINTWDDGTFQVGYPLFFNGNGTTQSYCQVHQQLVPVLQGAAGLGVYLEDAIGLAATVTFDSNGSLDISDVCTGPAPVCPTSALEIPAVDRTGIVALVVLLAGAALFWFARRRTASPR